MSRMLRDILESKGFDVKSFVIEKRPDSFSLTFIGCMGGSRSDGRAILDGRGGDCSRRSLPHAQSQGRSGDLARFCFY